MNYKKIIVIFLIFILLFFPVAVYAAEDPFPGEWKDGTSLSFMESNHKKGIMANWIIAGLSYFRIESFVEPLEGTIEAGVDSVGRDIHDIYDKISHTEGFDYVQQHLTCTVDEENNAIYYGIDDTADETTFRTYAKSIFRELVFLFSGDDAETTSPFEYVSDDGYFYIYLNGQLVAPWVLGSNMDINYAHGIENENKFIIRGDVFDADVGAWVTGLRANTERYKKLRLPYMANDDVLYDMSTSNNYSLTDTDATLAIKMYSQFTPTRYYYWTSLNLNPPNTIEGVIVPGVYYTNIGSVRGYYLRLFQYSWVSSGLRPSNWDANSKCWPISGYSSKPVKQYGAGDIVYKSEDGVDMSDIDYYVDNITNNQWVIYNTGDVTNMGDIINNYYNNDYDIYFNVDPSALPEPPKTDPTTWPVPWFPQDPLPDFDINWKIEDIEQYFPFSIPFDLMHFYDLLNAPPDAPHFEGSIDLGIYEWDVEIDLSDFDDLAALLRTLEYYGFLIGLIVITRDIIRG